MFIYRWNSWSTSDCSEDSSLSDPGKTSTSSLTYFGSGKQEHRILLDSKRLTRREHENAVYFVEFGNDKENFERCAIHSWIVHRKRMRRKSKSTIKDYEMEELNSKLSTIKKKEVGRLLTIPKHDNLVAFKGLSILRPDANCVCIHLIQDFVQGINLSYFLDLKIAINENLLYYVAKDCLEGLIFLHQNDIIHRNLRDSCIFLDHLSHCIKISDFAVERRISEAVADFIKGEVASVYPQSPGRGGKKCDIFRFGIIILSLFNADRVNEVSINFFSSNKGVFPKIWGHPAHTAQALLTQHFVSINDADF